MFLSLERVIELGKGRRERNQENINITPISRHVCTNSGLSDTGEETGSDKHAEWVVLFKLSMEVKR